ncbi:MAG: sulfatase-like hydrolase/transferase [Anaerolineales bacterium]
MVHHINRRDFLKILGLMPFIFSKARGSLPKRKVLEETYPNVLMIVFDAFSTSNISLYGYPRKTTPHLEALADRATVYHNHYAAGNFTTSGTASLLTGTYPWTHRAIQINNKVHNDFQTKNIFHLMDDFFRITYSHNQLVNILQDQFMEDIDLYKPREDLTRGKNKWLSKLFANDQDTATVSWARISGHIDHGLQSSLFLAELISYINDKKNTLLEKVFPLGLPVSSVDTFLLEDAVDWMKHILTNPPNPFLGYFHLLPPHAPYHTRGEFHEIFLDKDIQTISKPKHPLAKVGREKHFQNMDPHRRAYDEFILYVDSEFNRLYRALEKNGALDNTYLILTSDHGEMFERGIMGHMTPCLHEPVVRVPLLIFEPGQKHRKDVYSKTNAVDLLPTILHWTGKKIPPWAEGFVLPPYGSPPDGRSLYALEAKTNKSLLPLNAGSAMIIKGGYKLTKYSGYRHLPQSDPLVELYDIDQDPEEMHEMSTSHPQVTRRLLEELETQIRAADEPYR